MTSRRDIALGVRILRRIRREERCRCEKDSNSARYLARSTVSPTSCPYDNSSVWPSGSLSIAR